MGIINQLVTEGHHLTISISSGLRHSQIWYPLKASTCTCCLRSFRKFVQLMNGRAMMARLKTDINAFVRGRLKVLFHDLLTK